MNPSDLNFEAIDGHRGSAWMAQPVSEPRAAVIVVQEIFGVNSHIRSVTQGFATAGYLGLAPRLFERVEPGTELGYDDAGVARGRELVAQLGFDAALRDVAAVATWARNQGLGVCVVGFCWGGTAALLAATRLGLPAVSYYGGRSMGFLHERLQAPLMLHFGHRDPLIPAAHVARQRIAFAQAQVHEYDAGHGFNCAERTDFDAPSAALANTRTLDFLARHTRRP